MAVLPAGARLPAAKSHQNRQRGQSESAPRPAALPKQPPLPRPLRQRGAVFPEHSVSIRKAKASATSDAHGRRHECMSRRRYNALLQEREEAWDDAEAESDKTGNPYKNRNKEMMKPAPKDTIGLALLRSEWPALRVRRRAARSGPCSHAGPATKMPQNKHHAVALAPTQGPNVSTDCMIQGGIEALLRADRPALQ